MKEKIVSVGTTDKGEQYKIDITETPHMLVAGETNSGKTVFLYSLIHQLISNNTPEEIKFILCDPKLVEFDFLQNMPHLLGKIFNTPEEILDVLDALCGELEERILRFSESHARNIDDYNIKNPENKLPQIFVLIDEFADVIVGNKRKFTRYIKKLTSMAEFAGIHLILTTQRVQTDVITGIIRACFNTVVSFAVSDEKASKIIGIPGADWLFQKGELLYMNEKIPTLIHCQSENTTEEMIIF